MPTIHVVTGLNAGDEHKLEGRETLLGRHPDCQIVLRDSTVSRRHARITREGAAFYVDDVGSQHGTRVNGELIRVPCRLADGDEIQISQVTVVFRDSERESSAEHPSTIITSVDVIGEPGEIRDSQAAPRWRALLEITRSLGVSLDLKAVLPKVLDNVFRILPQATRGWILIAEKPSGRLQAYAVRQPADGADAAPHISRTLTGKVMAEGKAILSSDAAEDERFVSSDSMLDLKMRSLLCAPLVGASNEPLGMIHLDAQDPSRPFSADDLDVLVNIANLVGQAVAHSRLHETALQFDRRERDLATASQVQMHFLPQERPTLSGYELCDYYNPADAVGGDYFGYTSLPDGQLAIGVGDVAGHGVPAALLMARLCAEARYCLATHPIPADAVQTLNRHLTRQNLDFFITFVLCVIDPHRHEMTVVNAGHLPPLLRSARDGQITPVGLQIAKPPLGIDVAIHYEQATIPLRPGDVVMLYTDGVSEARTRDGAMYETERVQAALARSTGAEDAVRILLNDLQQFVRGAEQEDDICVVTLARTPNA